MKNVTTGLHILGEMTGAEKTNLVRVDYVRSQIEKYVKEAGLVCVGATHYVFPGNGFTLIIALAESHLSLHTWPELGYVTLDTFVCNINKDSSDSARILFKKVSDLFEPASLNKREIFR